MNEYEILAERLIALKERTKRMERILVDLREMFRFDDEDKWENTIKAIDEALK